MFDDEQDAARAKALIQSPPKTWICAVRDWWGVKTDNWGFQMGEGSLLFNSIFFARHGERKKKGCVIHDRTLDTLCGGVDDGIRL